MKVCQIKPTALKLLDESVMKEIESNLRIIVFQIDTTGIIVDLSEISRLAKDVLNLLGMSYEETKTDFSGCVSDEKKL